MSSLPDIDLDFLCGCLKAAGQMALAGRANVTASLKADRSPVTVVDQQVEDYLIERVLARYPGHRILSEESGARGEQGDFTWVIDPIDGTRAFASGLPIWGVSIGILRGETPAAGGFYMPVTGDLFWGTPQEAYHNDRRMQPPAVDFDSPLAFLAVPSNFHLRFEVRYPRVRSLGSTAAHLAYTAGGAAVGALLRNYSLWDIAGMLPILAAVGIAMQTLTGEGLPIGELTGGLKARRPLLLARPDVIEPLRTGIRLLDPRPAPG